MILLDASPLIALCDHRDSKNAEARQELAALAAESFAVPDAVLAEACFHLPHVHERRRLRRLLEELDVAALPAEAATEFRWEVFEWLIKYAEHEPDWADACLVILSSRHPRARVWSFDSEFRSIWRRPDGTSIPLAPG